MNPNPTWTRMHNCIRTCSDLDRTEPSTSRARTILNTNQTCPDPSPKQARATHESYFESSLGDPKRQFSDETACKVHLKCAQWPYWAHWVLWLLTHKLTNKATFLPSGHVFIHTMKSMQIYKNNNFVQDKKITANKNIFSLIRNITIFEVKKSRNLHFPLSYMHAIKSKESAHIDWTAVLDLIGTSFTQNVPFPLFWV